MRTTTRGIARPTGSAGARDVTRAVAIKILAPRAEATTATLACAMCGVDAVVGNGKAVQMVVAQLSPTTPSLWAATASRTLLRLAAQWQC